MTTPEPTGMQSAFNDSMEAITEILYMAFREASQIHLGYHGDDLDDTQEALLDELDALPNRLIGRLAVAHLQLDNARD